MAFLFHHIPKTAGTSFYKAVQDQLGSDAVELDYGPDMAHTTALVQKHIYAHKHPDAYGFYQAFKIADKTLLAGHFQLARYVHLFGARQTLTFLRDPIDRIISEYLYLKRQDVISQSFEGFIHDPRQTNKQSHTLKNVLWRALHLVGFTESYSADLALFNTANGLNIPTIDENRAPRGNSLSLTDDDLHQLRKDNQADMVLYREASYYLSDRKALLKQGLPFCHHSCSQKDNQLIGWAFIEDNNSQLPVGLFVDGELVSETLTHEYRVHLANIATPRGGYNGFRFRLKSAWRSILLEVKHMTTGQNLYKSNMQ